MKNVLVALVCTVGAVACGGESRPAETPATTTTSVTTETTTATAPDRNATDLSTSTPATGTGMGTTGTAGATGSRTGTTATQPAPAPAPVPAPAPAPADTNVTGTAPAANNPGSADNTKNATNTGINDRDRHGAVTPMDQGGGKDRDITAAIRRAVVSDGSLSFNAKNVKIITVGGKVTLRGPVKSDAEKATIESKAKSAAGVTEVDNQLEVKK